jgi:thiosulfate dehydrogenase
VKGFILGLVVAALILVGGVYTVVKRGLLPAGQDVKPVALEKWAAKTSLRATIQREAFGLNNPCRPTTPTFRPAQPCTWPTARCAMEAPMERPPRSPRASLPSLTPNSPQLAKHGVEDDPEGTTYWKIAHGIRFTGMPSFRQSLSEREMWQLAAFAKHMDKLPPAAREAWGGVGVNAEVSFRGPGSPSRTRVKRQ